MTIVEAAAACIARGWAPVPVVAGKKRPNLNEWEKLRVKDTKLFNDAGALGVILGEASHWLTDVDLDTPEAVYLGSLWLPMTGMVSGRTGRPRSHRWYVATGAKTSRWQDTTDPKKAAVLIEIRSNGGQTVLPPSPHPEGGLYTWDEAGDPAEVEVGLLKQRVSYVAAGALLARHWPAEGARHDLTLAISGWLLRTGMPVETCADFVEAVAHAAGYGEAPGRIRGDVADTAAAIAADQPATGGSRAAEIIGSSVLAQLQKWLEQADAFKAIEKPKPPTIITGMEGWRSRLVWKINAKGQQTQLQNHIVNAIEILANDEHWTGTLALNELSQTVELINRPPFENEDGVFLRRPLRDDDVSRTTAWLAAAHSLFVGTDIVAQAASAIAYRNGYHPVREYLDSLTWDTEPRLSCWLEDHCGAESVTGDGQYIRQVARAWMISAVARIYRPGCQVDHTLILEGKTSIGKSTVFRVLGGDWFTDQMPSLESKDSSMQVHAAWIIELAELDVMSRHDVARIKAFLTIKSDVFRPPFGRAVMRYDRQCVFAGTVNHTDYLRDETGNRRFWPVRCADEKIDIDGLVTNRDQLWAEAVVAYRNSEKWWLENEKVANAEQEDRMAGDAWDGPVAEYLASIRRPGGVKMSERAYVTLPGVFRAVGIPLERQGRAEQARVVSILKRFKWRRRQVRIKYGMREGRYIAPEDEDE